MTVTVVIGPPGAGKSHYDDQHATPNDVVIDLDRLRAALQPPTGTQPNRAQIHLAITARAAIITEAAHVDTHVWLIHAIPNRLHLADWARRGWPVITIDPGRDVCLTRIAQRPPVDQNFAKRGIDQWYRSQR